MSLVKIVTNPITDRTEGAEQQHNQRNNEQIDMAAKKAPSTEADRMKNKPTDLTITFQKSLIFSKDNSVSPYHPAGTPVLESPVAGQSSSAGTPLSLSPLSASLYVANPNRVMNNPYGLIRTTSPVMGHLKSPVLSVGNTNVFTENIEKQRSSPSNTISKSFPNPPPLPPQDQAKVVSEPLAPEFRRDTYHQYSPRSECLSAGSTFYGHDQLMEIVNSYIPDTPNSNPFLPLEAQTEPQCLEIEVQSVHERNTPLKDCTDHNSSSCSTNQRSLTKVYQNGRPIPAVRNSHTNSQNTSLSARQSCPEDEVAPVLPPVDVENNHPVPDFAVVAIQFRRSTELHMVRFAGKYLSIPVQSMLINAHVITEGDRGFDLGRIISVDEAATELMMEYRAKCTDEDLDLLMTFETAHSLKQACGIVPRRENNNNNGNNHSNTNDQQSMLPPTHILARCAKFPFVTRNASQQEVDDYHYTQANDESRALSYAQEQCARCLPLDISIIDATFQFDRQKLTLWYTAPERVYFVSLLKVLNQRFRCRIWMERVEGKVTHTPLGQQYITSTGPHQPFNNNNNNNTMSGYNPIANSRNLSVTSGFGSGYHHNNTNNNQNNNKQQHQQFNTNYGVSQPHDTYYTSDRHQHHRDSANNNNNNGLRFLHSPQQTDDMSNGTIGHHPYHQQMEPICNSSHPSINNNINNVNLSSAQQSTRRTSNAQQSYGGRKRVTRYTHPDEADVIVNAARKVVVSAPPTETAGAAKRLNFDS
eukprot:Tbor_TRINITY_DN5563_c2_g5::TRINITY_DN5563_c2_g5_i1::g.13228::m.13228